MEDRRKVLYDRLHKEYDLGDFESFSNGLNDERVRKNFYNIVSERYDIGDYDTFVSEIDRKPQQEENDALFEENMKLAQQGMPTKKVTTQSMIDAHPELGLKSTPVKTNTSSWEQPTYDWRTEQQKQMDELRNSTTATPVQDQYGNEYYPVKPREVAYDEAVRSLDDISERKARTQSQLQTINEDVNKALGELQSRVQVSGLDKFRPANLQSMPVNPVNQELMPEYTALRKAQRLVEESNNIIEEASKKGNTSFMAGLARGFWDNLNAEDYTFGADDAAQSAYLYQALDKAERGEKLTKAEETLLDAAAINMAVQAYYAQDLGRGYGAGSVTAESIPFMMEMAINPISGFGKASAKKLLGYGVKKFLGRTLKGLGKGAVAGMGMAATTGAGDVLEGATDRLAQNYRYTLDAEGNLSVEKKRDMGMGEALTRSFATRAIENQSEMIFNAFKGMGGFMKGVQDVMPGGVNKFFDLLKNNKAADAYRWLKNSKVFRNYLTKDLRNATQIGGLGEEYLEEVYNNLANFAIGEMEWKDVVSLDNNIDTMLGLVPTQVMFGLLGLGGAGAMRYQTRKTLEDLQATMNEQQRRDLEGLLDLGLDAKEVDVRGFIRNVMQNENYTIENKRDLIKAAYYVAKQKGIDELTEADTIDKVSAENAIIDSMTDPSTGVYSELVAKLPDGQGGQEEVSGCVVGWIGEGDKRQPVFVPEGMENTYENRRVLRPTEWVKESLQEMPAEQVKAVSEEMIREEAAQQAEMEAKYAPEVINAQMQQGVPFNTPTSQIIPISPLPEGNGWVVEEYALDTNNKVAKTPIVRELTNDEYRDMLQSQIDAQEAVNAPVNNVASGENVGEQVNAGVNAPVNNAQPFAEGVATEQQAAQPKQPTLEDVVATLPKTNKGEIDYKAMTPQQQYQYTSLTESPEVALEDLQADIAAGQEEIAKKQEKLAKAIGGERAALRDEVRKLTQAQAELQSFYDSVAPKPEVAAEDTAQPVEEAVTEPTAQAEAVQPQAEVAEEQAVEQPSEEVSAPEVISEQVGAEEQSDNTGGTPEESEDVKAPLRNRAKEWEQKLGVKVNLIESLDEVTNREVIRAIQNGQRVTGWFEESTGEVCFYMPYLESESEVDSTYIHEVVAHKGLRGLLGDKFDSFCDDVWESMSVMDQAKFINYPGVNSIEAETKEETIIKIKRAAADEYIAHLAENIDVTDSVWSPFIELIKKFLKAIGLEPKMTNADIANTIKKSYQRLLKSGTEGSRMRAVERIEENVGEVDAEKGDVRFAVRDVLKGEEREQAIKDLMAVTGRSRRTVVKWLKAEESLASVILNEDNVGILDMEADESVPSIWKNSDYPQGTVEFSNICKKRLPFTTIYQRLQKEFPNTLFDAQTLNTIRSTMKEMGEDVACALCFVEDRRQLLGEIGQGFIDAVKGMDVEVNDNQKAALDKLRESGDKYVPNLFDIITLDGMKELRKKHPAVAQAFIEYNNARGMQSGRLFQAYSAYNREILKYSKKKVDSINNNGGLRIFSFSDFEAHHLIDLVQVLTDCAAKGIKVQGYTKVPEFAKAVKDTNAKINRSLIPKGVGYVDADYVPKEGEAVSPNVINGKRLLFDTIEGIDVNNPNFFDSTGSKSVGNILVAINDEHARLAMADPFVDYIIGFHTGQSKAILKGKGIDTWVNYKNEQLDKEIVTDENGNQKMKNAPHHGLNIYTDVLNVAEAEGNPIRTAKQFTERFIEECNKRGWIPRFHRFLNRAKDGRFLYTPGYHKFLIDFKLFDKNGRILPQEAVVPKFDDAFNKQILDDYVKGVKEEMPNDAVYEAVKEAVGLGEGTRFRISNEEKESLRNSEESKALFEAAKKKFGVTSNSHEAGYILPDGSMLDFSGRHEVETDASHLAGGRHVDHREIKKIAYDKDDNETGLETSLTDFIERGAIRIQDGHDDYALVNLDYKPTAKQKSVLRTILSRNPMVDVDFGNGWNTEHHAEYDEAKAARILADIEKYYDEGIKPVGNVSFRISDYGKKVKAEVDKVSSKYNSKDVMFFDNEMTDEEVSSVIPGYTAADIKPYFDEGILGGYSSGMGKISIFANNNPVSDIEDTLFHENLHSLLKSRQSIVEAFAENALERFPKNVKKLQDSNYEEKDIPEELLVRLTAKAMVYGIFDDVAYNLPEGEFENLKELLKEFGYEYEQEIKSRALAEGRRGTPTLLEGEEIHETRRNGQDASGRQGEVGKGRKRKEQLGKLLDQVADMGLEGVLGNKAYFSMMVDIYKAMPEDVRAEIADDAIRHYGGSVAPAVNDFIGPKSDGSFMDKVVAIVREALRKVGFDLDLNANEVRYMIWRSKKPLDRNNLLEVAEDIDMKNRLKVGEYDGSPTPDGGGTRFSVKPKPKTKAELKEEVRDLKEDVRSLKDEVRDLKKQVNTLRSGNKDEWEQKQRAIVSFIKGRLTKEAGSVLGKTRLDQLLTLVNKASTATDLRKPLQFIEQVINDASIEHAAAKMDKLIKTRLQGETNRGVAKGVVVDESTRRLFDSIRGTFKELIATSIDSELRSVRGEILRFGKEINALPKDDIQGRAILTARQEAMKERRKELEAEQEELQRQNINETKESLERRHDELVEAMDAHIEGEGVWTQEMQDEYDSIPLRLKLAEIRESQAQLDAIMSDAIMTRRNAYQNTGETRKKLLAEADVIESNYTIAQEELIRLMNEVSSELSAIINEGKSRLATRRQALAERRRAIVTMGISAVKDKKVKDPNANLSRKEKFDKWFDNSWLKSVSDFMTAPLNSFNFMLKYIDRNHTIGEGELYNHFMKSEEGALEANNRLYDGLKAYNTAIEEKAKEIFGKDIEAVMKDSGKEYTDKVHKQYMYDSSSHKEGDMYPISITKGQALYVWLTWRQDDGRAKLLADGWNDQSIEEIEALIGEDYMKFGEWITDEFFPMLREEKYNKTHIDMFGTSMAKREHYFPFKVQSEDIQEKGEMGESYSGMPSTITGNIIKRTINKSRIKTDQNAFDLLYKYGNDMETWNAMAKLRQDLNFLHSSKAFRNYLEANSKGLFDKFMKAAEVAVKAYNNSAEANPINDFLVKFNRMWAGSNIGFRLNTAMKQILSYPAFMAYSGNPKFQLNLGKYMLNWKGNYDWAKENLPAFRNRVETGDMGMTGMTDPQFDFVKYIKKFTDAGMIPNQLVDALTCAAGARSVYDFEYDRAIKAGMSEDEARNIAQYNAEVAFNETQQSSRDEFVSPIQVSRNVLIKSMMNYQNSNVGYQRMGNEGFLEIMRAKHVYEQDVKSGMSEGEAKKKVTNSILRGTRKMMIAFTILPGLWYLGGRGIVGITSPLISSLFGRGDDDEPYLDDEAKEGLILSMILGTVAGTTGGQAIASVVQGREYEPMAYVKEFSKIITDVVKDGFNLNTTKNMAFKMAKFGGVNIETFENIYLGVEHAIRTGNFDLVDFMFLINLPPSQRKAMAEELYSDMPFMEYAEKVSRAQKLFDDYRKNLPYAKGDKNGSKKNAIKKQYVIENLSDDKQDKLEKEKEFKKLQREYNSAEDKAEWLKDNPEYTELEKNFKSQEVTKEVNREAKKLK